MTTCIRWMGLVVWMTFCIRAAAGAPDPAAGPRESAPASTKGVDAWIADLRSAEPRARVAAADALGTMGARAKDAIPTLVQALRETNPWVANAISEALVGIGEPAVLALAEALGSDTDSVRMRAAMVLRGIGPAAKPAEPALRKALDDPNARVRVQAAGALKAIESPAAQPGAGKSPAPLSPATGVEAAAGRLPVPIDGSHDWPGFRGLRRDAICTESGLMRQWPESGPNLLWKVEGLGTGYSSVSIAGGRLFTMGDRAAGDKKTQFVLAYDLKMRKPIWAVPVGPPHSDGPRCTPTVDGDTLYALGTDGGLVCLDAATGAVRWRKHLVNDFGGRIMTVWKFSESPLVDGDRVVCTPGGASVGLAALKKATGETIWTCVLPELGERGKDGAGYSSMVAAEIEGVRQYIQIVGRGAVGVAADTGRFLWGYNRIANETANVPTPIVRGNLVFVTTSYRTGSALLKIVRDGESFRAEEVYFLGPEAFENHHGGVVLAGDWVYGGDGLNRGTPVCLNFATGEIAWKPKVPARGSAAALYADGHILFRYDRGDVLWVEASPREFRVHGRFKPETGEGPAWAYPVIHDKKLYLRHGDLLACYDLSDR